MASVPSGAAFRQVARLFGGETLLGLGEADLLRRFALRRDPAALEALVARHGPMVLGVCRRVLGSGPDCDDAFQATFLVLVKKAGAIRDPNLVGPWLHGVAHRVAVRARANAAIRRSRERAGAAGEAAMAASIGCEGEDHVGRAELRATLDDEVARLPERFRKVVVLCYLDGLTHEQAAERLRCPVGTVRSRLATARERLRAGLARRGVGAAGSAVAFASALSAETARAAVPLALAESTLSAGMALISGGAAAATAGMVSAGAASLADGATTAMFLTKMKVLGGIALAGALTAGVGGAAAVQYGAGGGAGGAVARDDDPVDEIVAKLRRETEARVRKSEQEAVTLRLEADALRRQVAELMMELASLKHERKLQGGQKAGPVELFAPAGRSNRVAARGGQGRASEAVNGGPGAAAAGAGLFGAGGASAGSPVAGAASGGGGAPTAGNPGGFGRGGGSMAGASGGQGSAMAGMMGGGGRGGFGGMTGMGGGGFASSRGVVVAQASGDYVLIQKPDGREIVASNPETGKSVAYAVPEGTTATPIVGPFLVALHCEGPAIGRIAVFDPAKGAWSATELKEPAEGRASPIVGEGLAAYPVGRRVYVYSAKSGGWDSVEVAGGQDPAPIVAHNRVTIEGKDRLYVFGAKTGKWTDHEAGVLVEHKNRLYVYNTKTGAWTNIDGELADPVFK